MMTYPSVYSAPIVPDQESSLISGFHKMEIIFSFHTGQHYISDREVCGIYRLDRDKVAIINLSFHGMAAWTNLYGLTSF